MKKLLIVLFFITTLSSCTYTTLSGFTNYNRSQLMLTSADQINTQADQAYSQVIKQAKDKKLLNTNKQTTARVKRIANKLIAATSAFRPDAKQWNWEVNVITSDTVNAWCMPGGKIVVYSGIINKLKLTDDEIAIVVGHEIVHALREHSREQQSREMIKSGIIAIAAIMGAERGTLALGNTVANLGFSLPFNRQQETEADTIGLELAYRAGFNPDAAVSVWQKMSKMGGEQPPEFLSTHPSYEHRIDNLQQIANQLKLMKRKNSSKI